MLVLGLLFILVLIILKITSTSRRYVNEIHGGVLYKNDCLVSATLESIDMESFLTPSGVTGQQLVSNDGVYSLILQNDGNLIMYNGSGTNIWQSGTVGQGIAPYRALMESTGNFVVYDSQNTKLWETKTSTSDSSLLLENGVFKIFDSSNKMLWISDCNALTNGPFTADCLKTWWSEKGCTTDITKQGFDLKLGNTGTALAMQTYFNTLATTKDNVSSLSCYGISAFQKYKVSKLSSGDVLSSVSSVYPNGDRLWSPDGTSFYLTFESNGNLVVKNASDNIIWDASASSGSPPYSLKIVIGNLLLNNSYGTTYWSVNTGLANYLTIDNDGALRLFTGTRLLWISDCSKITNGPFTENCLKQWWSDKGCTTTITNNSNYTSWSSNTSTATAMQSTFNTLATTQDEASSQACYQLSVFDKYKLSTINSGQSLSSTPSSSAYWNPDGQRLWSPDGTSYYLALQKNGNLAVYNNIGAAVSYRNNSGTIIWQTNTAGQGTAPYKAQMDTDGDFVIYDSVNTKLWRSYTNLTNTNSYLTLNNTGGLTIFSKNRSNEIQWMSKFDTSKLSTLGVGELLLPGQSIWSPDGSSYKLTVLSSGNLVLYDSSSNIIWQTNTATAGTVVYKLKMAKNGVLTLFDGSTGKWSPSGAGGGTAVVLNLDNNGLLTLIDTSNNSIKWVSDCSRITTGPFTSTCLQSWWSSKKCTTSVSKHTNYSSWLSNTGASTDIQSIFSTISTTPDETSSQVCYGKSVYEKYKISTLPSGAAISSSTTSYNANRLWSPDGTSYSLIPQNNGNLVLYNSSGTSVWSSGTSGTSSPYKLYMQTDGNLVLYDKSNTAKWSSGTTGSGVKLVLTNDGIFYLVDSSNKLKWISK